ncbi:MAG: hypothetical protein AAF483_23770 [Planctomycetota bacterium]
MSNNRPGLLLYTSLIRYTLVGGACFLAGVAAMFFANRDSGRSGAAVSQGDNPNTTSSQLDVTTGHARIRNLIAKGAAVTPSEGIELMAALEEMARSDLDGAVRDADNFLGQERLSYIAGLATAIGKLGLSEALLFPESFSNPNERKMATVALLHSVASYNPELLSSWLGEGAIQTGSETESLAIAILAQSNPKSMSDSLGQLDKESRIKAIGSLAYQYAAGDSLDQGIAWANSLESPTERETAFIQIVSALSTTDPAQAAELLLQSEQSPQRSGVIQTIVHNWAESDPDAAMEWIENETKSQVRNIALVSFSQALTPKDPQRAAEFLDEMPFGKGREDSIRMVASEWAKVNAQDAIGWLDSLAEADRSIALGPFLDAWAIEEPRAAIEFAAERTEEIAFPERLLRWVSHWGRSNSQEALEWSQQTGDDQIVRHALLSAATTEPDAATQSLGAISNSELRQQTTRDLLATIANEDPEQAFNRYVNLPEGLSNEKAIQTIIFKWVRISPREASEVVSQMPSGADRDIGALEITNYLIQKNDYESAFHWAQEVSDASRRRQWMARALHGLSIESAQQLLDASAVNGADRQVIEQRLGRP